MNGTTLRMRFTVAMVAIARNRVVLLEKISAKILLCVALSSSLSLRL
jgi:hypothetical protein